MTHTAAPEASAAPPGPPPLALAVAYDLVTRHRLRLADERDSRLGPLMGRYLLAAGAFTGHRAALVAFFDPPAGAEEADLRRRVEDAFSWGEERLRVQAVDRCDVLLVALRPLPRLDLPSARGAVHVGVIWADAATGDAQALGGVPGGLPSAGDVRRHAQRLRRGEIAPTLAQVDLAERQAIAAGYAAPAQRRVQLQPTGTYALIGACLAIYAIQQIGNGVNAHFVDAVYTAGQYNNVAASGDQISVTQGGVLVGGAGDWWRYVTASFLHVSLIHVALNSWSLFVLGRLIEQLYGRLAMVAAFLLTGAGGMAFWFACHELGVASGGPGVGASAGICGFLGLIAVFGRVQGRGAPAAMTAALRNMVWINVALLVFMGASLQGVINNYAHAGGFLTGMVVGLWLPPDAAFGGRTLQRGERLVLGAVIAAGAAALVYGASLVPHFLQLLTPPAA